MSDDTKATPESPEADPAATGAQPVSAAPPYQILAQYIKDMSFENPNAPAIFTENQQPQAALTLDVTTTSLGGRDVEVVLSIEARAEQDGKTGYLLELAYAAVVRVGPIPKEALNALLYVEVPRMLFPFLRQIVSDATRAGGFTMLLLAPFDFTQIYRKRLAQEQAEQAAAEQGAAEQPESETATV